ncbi:transposase [Gigaspora margarita]|uniref:Transposase n=1 Tax=Gigaspora margarita TaxID=4874 RepID=A0A8H4ACZ9_GIGMA|nr:transposase [Gigaspora margarita]
MSPTKRKSYTVKQKLEIISKSKEISNKEIARIYGIDHSQVSRWQKQEEKLEEAPRSIRSVGSGRKAAYPLAEKELSQWIVQLRQNGIAVTLSSIKLKMKELLRTKFQHDYPNALDTFEASNTDIVVNSFKKCGIPDGIEELEELVIVSAEDVENLLIPIVYVENSENLPRHWNVIMHDEVYGFLPSRMASSQNLIFD